MTTRRGTLRFAALVAGLVAGLLACGAAAAADDFVRAPVLLYISGSTAGRLPEPLPEVRAFTTGRLDEALTAAGADAIPSERLVPLLMSHRVRGPLGLDPAFLADLGRDSGANHVLVAVLLVEFDRLQLLARLVRLEDGCVVWAAGDEEPLPDRKADVPDPSGWYAALGRLVARCQPTAVTTPAAGAPLLAMLPARGVGCEPELALTATHAVLAAACADSTCRIADPGVVAGLLAAVGTPADRLDAAGRRRLGEVLGQDAVLAPELLVYGVASGRAIAGDGDDVLPADVTVSEYALGLRLVDGRTGLLLAEASRHHEHGVRIGWFGVADRTSVMTGLGRAAQEIWHDMNHNPEDFR